MDIHAKHGIGIEMHAWPRGAINALSCDVGSSGHPRCSVTEMISVRANFQRGVSDSERNVAISVGTADHREGSLSRWSAREDSRKRSVRELSYIEVDVKGKPSIGEYTLTAAATLPTSFGRM